MPLTRSLYREDEVIAALKWCVIRGRFNEALFWAQEAIDSNMSEEFLKALVWVWLFTCGPKSIRWISYLHKCIENPPTEDSYIHLLLNLMYNVKYAGDTSVLSLLGLGLCYGKKQPNTITLIKVPEPLPNVPVVRALLQGKVDLAWSILRPEWSKNPWELLRNILSVKNKHTLPYFDEVATAEKWMRSLWTPNLLWCFRAVATVLVATTGSLTIMDEYNSYNHILESYARHTNLSMRKRRLYEVPYECLYWLTTRGWNRVNETTESEIQLNLEDSLKGSKYWSSLLPIGYDLSREEFFYKHFQDDIPDEWSTLARLKSHGYGSVPVGNKICHSTILNRCLVRWFSHIPSKSVWRGFEIALEEFTQRWRYKAPSSLEDGIHEAYEEKDVDSWINEMESWSLNPKKPRFVVSHPSLT